MSTTDYASFIARKSAQTPAAGITIAPSALDPRLYPFQRDLVSRALASGRFCLFTDTGSGKTAMQLAWASHVAHTGRVLILAPLAVAEQTVREGAKFDIPVRYLRDDDPTAPIVITNYEMLSHFDPDSFAGVVLDESSILKAYNGKTRTEIIRAFAATPFRLACTATPAPNDYLELGNHAEFLGVKSRSEMLAEFFVHDGGSTQDWRLKGHAREAFWRWVCGWAAVLSRPSDLGYEDGAFILPPLEMHEHIIAVEHKEAWAEGYLFAPDATTLSEQRAVRRATTDKRAKLIADLAAGDEPVLIWCELNKEGDAITKAILGAVQVAGADSLEEKVDRLRGFAEGRYRVLVSKASIAGFGMNYQHCARMIFVGVSHSFEMTYQAIRRCWRYGQTRPVHVHVLRAETEAAIVDNYRRKEREHREMVAQMVSYANRGQVGQRWNPYEPARKMEVPAWLR